MSTPFLGVLGGGGGSGDFPWVQGEFLASIFWVGRVCKGSYESDRRYQNHAAPTGASTAGSARRSAKGRPWGRASEGATAWDRRTSARAKPRRRQPLRRRADVADCGRRSRRLDPPQRRAAVVRGPTGPPKRRARPEAARGRCTARSRDPPRITLESVARGPRDSSESRCKKKCGAARKGSAEAPG